MKIIDLSHAITNGMPVFPGTPPPAITPTATLAHHGYAESQLTFTSHTGTHIDAPSHLLVGTRSLDQFDLSSFHGPAWVMDFPSPERGFITLADLLIDAEEIARCGFLLLRTGWSNHWGQEAYFSGYPVLSKEAVSWLANLPLKGVGIDTISIDPLDSPDLPNHRALLRREILIVENLTNLAALPSGRIIFNCMPLPIGNADGAPVRAIAFIPAVPGQPSKFF